MAHKIGVKLRTLKLRKMRHMTQQQLAEQAKLSKTTISNLESGSQTKIELETIAKLCNALHCTPADLFELVENSQNDLLQSQKKALTPFIGALEYDILFDPKELDKELANIINISKTRQER